MASLLKTNTLDGIFTLSTNCKYFDLFQLQKHSGLVLFLFISKALSPWLHSSCFVCLFLTGSLQFLTEQSQLSWPQTPNRSEWTLALFVQWITAIKQIMICCIKALLFPITVFSLSWRWLSQYVPIYFEFFTCTMPCFEAIQFRHCFPQKLLKFWF